MTNSDIPVKVKTKQIANEIINKYDTFLFDCDGVLWLGEHLLPKIRETIEMLKCKNKSLYFVTNNSTKSRSAYLKKFNSFGISVNKDQVFTSSYAASLYVRDYLCLVPGKDKIWVFGESGIVDELNSMGYETLGGSDSLLDTPFDSQTSPFLANGLDPEVKCVLAGLDTHINYHRLAIALQYLRNPKVAFVATNVDSTLPHKGAILPGAGSIISCLKEASGRVPSICGKPNQNMLDAIISATHIDRSTTCMIGDRLNTDIMFGKEGGLGTLLVLTGIETEKRALHTTCEYPNPDYYADSVGLLYELTNGP